MRPVRNSTLEPLRHPIFRRFWLSNMVSSLGATIQTVGAAWMMASLTNDAQMVALVQTFASLPMMFISLPAGALADIYDRRRIMLLAQVGMLLASAGLAGLSLAGYASPAVLLLATFIIGAGMALHGPSWQASVPEMVPQDAFETAVGMNAVGFNLSRSIGPATGGLIVATAGAAAAFALNALSYLAMIISILLWRRPPKPALLPPEAVPGAIAAGLRYTALSPALIAIIVRAGIFGLCGSCVWALTAVLAREGLDSGPIAYGLLLAGFGAGAVIGALTRPFIPIGREQLVRACTLIFGISAVLLGLSGNLLVSVLLMAFAGGSWVVTLSGLGASVQIVAPRWVAGRAVAINSVVIFAGLAFGSWVWGIVASTSGVGTAFVASGAAMLASLLLAPLFPLTGDEPMDLSPARSTRPDELEGPVKPGDGPIVVTVEYRVRPENFRAFVEAAEALGRIRRRDGAHRWTLHQDVDEPTLWLERFHSATWLDHLRRQVRLTKADQAARDRVTALHEGEIVVRRLLERRISTEPLGMPDEGDNATRL